MSGVFGFVDRQGIIQSRHLLDKMTRSMSHRNWYETDSHVDELHHVALGRLGIGIFNREKQPIWNAEETACIMMAGELYERSTQLGNVSLSDEAYVLNLYDRYGQDFVHHLRGAFIVAIFDKHQKCLTIANDRFGLYPLYFAYRSGFFIFAPEIKGILCDEQFAPELDLIALAQYMRFQHLLGERTFFENVEMLAPASLFQYQLTTDSYSIVPYWSFGDIPHRPHITFNEAVEEASALLRCSVKRLSSDLYRPGVYLSGGLDSRSILGMIEQRPVASLNYGTQKCRDVMIAQRIAKVLGSQHHWVDFPDGNWVKDNVNFHLEVTEGFHSWIHMHGISTLPLARKIMDVNLSGWDGGTVMGHNDSIEPMQINAVDDTALSTRLFHLFNQKYTWPSITEAEEALLFRSDVYKQIRGLAFESFHQELRQFLGYRNDVRGEFFYLRNHCSRLTHNHVTFTRSHIEVRFPFFDYDLFNFLYSLPAAIRGHRHLYRAVIQRELPKLAYIPYDRDELLPTTNKLLRGAHSVGVKLKQKANHHLGKIFPQHPVLYADYSEYLRKELSGWAKELLYDEQVAKQGIFEPTYLKTLMNHHSANHETFTIGKIAPIITYQMMLNRFYN